MRLIHRVPFSPQEIESYRQLTFENVTRGLKYLLDAMEDMDLQVLEENVAYVAMVEGAEDLRDGEPFPKEFHQPLKSLWEDPNVQKAYARGNEAALPEKCAAISFSQLTSSDLRLVCSTFTRHSTACSIRSTSR